MTGVSQLDFHPDAEQLAAFAEQALPETEQAAVLAHVGECGRCRAIVFLASDAALAEDAGTAAADAPAPIKVPRRRLAWLNGWRWAWMPATALALVALTAWLVRSHHGVPQSAELATPPPPAAALNAASKPAPQTAAENRTSVPAQAPRAEKQSMSGTLRASSFQEPEEEDATIAAHATGGVAPGTAPGTAPGAAGLTTGVVEPMPEAGLPRPFLRTQRPTESNMQPLREDGSAPDRTLYAQTARAARALESNSAAAAQNSNQQLIRAQVRPVTPSAGKSFTLASVHNLVLANGEPPAALARGAQRILALDKAGNLYLSQDQGMSWEPVPTQWSGRAVTVELRSTTPFGAAAPRSGNGGAGGQQATIEAQDNSLEGIDLFELSNDNGQAWISTDGRIWRAQK